MAARPLAVKKRRRKHSKRKRGYRDEFTIVRITEILTDGKQPNLTAKPKAASKPKAEAKATADTDEDAAPKAKSKAKTRARKPAKSVKRKKK